jgi:hypothetical protein
LDFNTVLIFVRFASFGLIWKQVPLDVQDKLRALILQHLPGFNKEEFSNLLYRLVNLLLTACSFFLSLVSFCSFTSNSLAILDVPWKELLQLPRFIDKLDTLSPTFSSHQCRDVLFWY